MRVPDVEGGGRKMEAGREVALVPRWLAAGTVLVAMSAAMPAHPSATEAVDSGDKAEAPVVPREVLERIRRRDDAYAALGKRYGVRLGGREGEQSPRYFDLDAGGNYWAIRMTVKETPPTRREYVVILNPDLSERKKITLDWASITKRDRKGEYRESVGYMVDFGRVSRSVAIQEIRSTWREGQEGGQVEGIRLKVIDFSGKTVLDEPESTCLYKTMLCRDGRRFALLYEDLTRERPECSDRYLEFREIKKGFWRNSSSLLKRVQIQIPGGIVLSNSMDGDHVVVRYLRSGYSSVYDFNGELTRGDRVVAEEE